MNGCHQGFLSGVVLLDRSWWRRVTRARRQRSTTPLARWSDAEITAGVVGMFLWALIAGCSERPAPKPPDPIAMAAPAAFADHDSWPALASTERIDLTGRWRVDAHITQQGAGPPLRVRAEVSVVFDRRGEATVDPAKTQLEPAALGAPPRNGWPHGIIARLTEAARLARWLEAPPELPAGCTVAERKVTATWRAAPSSGHRWLSATVDGRSVLQGWLQRGPGGQLIGGHLTAVRWFSLSGACAFEQTERYDLTLDND